MAPPRTRPAGLSPALLGAVAVLVVLGCTGRVGSPAPLPTSPSTAPGSWASVATRPEASEPTSTDPITVGPDSSLPVQTPTAAPTDPPPTASPKLVPAAFPVALSAEYVADGIRMAPARDGRLWVFVPARGGGVLGLLDAGGVPVRGWPVVLKGSSSCQAILAVGDGTVRAVCSVDRADELQVNPTVFAFDADARPLAGWPVEVGSGVATMIGTDLVVAAVRYFGDVVADGEISHAVRIQHVHADGTIANGSEQLLKEECCPAAWLISPDGIAYQVRHLIASSWAATTVQIIAIDDRGLRAGWPVSLPVDTSDAAAFDAAGDFYLTSRAGSDTPSQTIVLDRDGKRLPASSGSLQIAATGTWDGAGDVFPGPPIVAGDGTAFVVETGDQTAIAAIDGAGRPLPGWPYVTNPGVQWLSFCHDGDTGCGSTRSMPVIGPGNSLFVSLAADGAGGRLIALNADGHVRGGWPITLSRTGSEFWSVAVAADGTVFALVIEPEKGLTNSATILGIAPDSTVRFAKTLMEP